MRWLLVLCLLTACGSDEAPPPPLQDAATRDASVMDSGRDASLDAFVDVDEGAVDGSEPAFIGIGKALGLGRSHSCGWGAQDWIGAQVRCWGSNSHGQLGTSEGLGDVLLRPTRTDWEEEAPAHVVGGDRHTCGLQQDAPRQVFCWGDNSSRQLGHRDAGGPEPRVVEGLDEVYQVVAGQAHTCALRGDHSVWCWGDNFYGQLGRSDPSATAPAPLSELPGTPWHLGAGARHTCAVVDENERREVYCWGEGRRGQLGPSATTELVTTPVLVPLEVEPRLVFPSTHYSCAIAGDFEVWCWGAIEDRTLIVPGLEDALGSAFAQRLRTPSIEANIIELAPGEEHFCLHAQNSQIWCFAPDARLELSPVLELLGGPAHRCVYDPVGRVFCWGDNEDGQLGNDSRDSEDAPVEIFTEF